MRASQRASTRDYFNQQEQFLKFSILHCSMYLRAARTRHRTLNLFLSRNNHPLCMCSIPLSYCLNVFKRACLSLSSRLRHALRSVGDFRAPGGDEFSHARENYFVRARAGIRGERVTHDERAKNEQFDVTRPIWRRTFRERHHVGA